jgi:predicted phosphodiesterase
MITVIGDVHGKYNEYLDICAANEYTVQIGDLGYNNTAVLPALSSNNHKFILGNHDRHDVDYYDLPHCLGRYGFYKLNEIKFFFVSGGFSIDQEYRKKMYYSGQWPKTYFEEEELSPEECQKALELYREIKPDLMLTHEAPRSIIHEFTNSEILKNFGYNPNTFTTRTSELLQAMFEYHQPQTWIFGHYHNSLNKKINGTHFQLLDELETYTIGLDE